MRVKMRKSGNQMHLPSPTMLSLSLSISLTLLIGAYLLSVYMRSLAGFSPTGMSEVTASGGFGLSPASYTPLHTPLPTYTATYTPTPHPSCGPGSDYIITQSTGASIVPGTTDRGNHCDDCWTTISLPFSFNLYDAPFNSVNVSSNGNLQFGNTNIDINNDCLPTAAVNNAILAHWDDLRTDRTGGGVYTSVSGSAPNRVFNIEWRAVYYFGGGTANFEVRLYEAQPQFDVIYGIVGQGGSSATVGVQRGISPLAQSTQFSCNTPGLFSGLLLTFVPTTCVSPTPTVTGTPPTATRTPVPIYTLTPCPNCPTLTPSPCPGATHYLVPEAGAPPNGGTISVGQRFVLDLRVNSGPYDDLADQEAYLTFDYPLLQNVRTTQPGCVLTSTVTADHTAFNAEIQNEVCNGPEPCVFPTGGNTDPGSIGFDSGVLTIPPRGGDFRVAQIAFCATAPGQARLHWQFSPPDPPNRDTVIFRDDGEHVQNPACYVDYVINIIPSTSTPTTPTNTPNPMNSPTMTRTPSQLLVGHVAWQGPPPQPHERQQLPVTLTLKMGETGAEVNYPKITTDASGYFTVSVDMLPNGTYNWRAKGPIYLAEAGMVTLDGVPVTNVDMGLMRAGDANYDNLVGIGDFNILKSRFGLAGPLPPDFNNDNLVDIADFNLLKINFGQGGAPPINPGER